MHYMFAIILFCALYSLSGSTSSIRPVSFDELCTKAEFIFEGRVTNVQTQQDYTSGNIWTFLTFNVLNKIKGPDTGTNVTLKFLGGTFGALSQNISDSVYPKLNEHGIYFVESLSENLVNPLLGWSQGHFIIKTDNTGTERVLTNSLHPVTDIRELQDIFADIAVSADTLPDISPVSDAISSTEFKTIIQNTQ